MESDLTASFAKELASTPKIADIFSIPQETIEEFNDGGSDHTILSVESQDFDSNQGTLSSESAEPIHENFQGMGIDNNWQESADHSPTAHLSSSDIPLPLSSHGFYNFEGMPLHSSVPNGFYTFEGPSLESELADVAPATTSSPESNMQLVPYIGPIGPPNIVPPTKECKSVAGCCGLSNLGNTCYMNAGLQCLVATKDLVQFFVPDALPLSPTDQPHASSIISAALYNIHTRPGDNPGSLTNHFSQLLTRMWSGKFSIIRPQEFKTSFGLRHQQFSDNSQHDCQEFLALLLDTLHEQLNTAGKAPVPLRLTSSPNKVYKEAAVAGCSRQEEEASPSQSVENSLSSSPGRSSNIDVAKLLEKKHIDKFEKNHLEQVRSPQASPSSVPSAVVSPCSPSSINLLGSGDATALGGLDIKDIYKEAKTSNVNVLAPHLGESRPNNQIMFDSEKYGGTSRHMLGTATAVSPRGIRNLGLRDVVLVENPNNLSECSDKDEASSLLQEPLHKKLKQTNLQQQHVTPSATVTSEDLKCVLGASNDFSDDKWMEEREEDSGSSYKKLKLVDTIIKNKEAMFEEGVTDMEDEINAGEDDECIDSAQYEAAQTHWDQHLSSNQSVIVDTFQGQFRSTVVCSMCNHKSVTFEPFMYLSVPLPHAMELQLEVTFVSSIPCDPALKFMVNLNRTATVEKLKEEVRTLARRDADVDLAVCESLESRISKILNSTDQLEKSPRDRIIYVFEMPKMDWLQPEQVSEEPAEIEMGAEAMEVTAAGDADSIPKGTKPPCPLDLTPSLPPVQHQDEGSLPWPKCNICLEDVEISKQPLKHGDDCPCVLCATCLQECKAHQIASESTLKCPVCHRVVDPDVDFVVMTSIDSKCKPSTWLVPVPVVFRVDEEGEEYNNRRTSTLYGHPRLFHLPSKISGARLYEALLPYAPNPNFTLLQVGGNGLLCSLCMYNDHCKGCPINSSANEEVELQPNGMLAVRTNQLPTESMPTLEHVSMKGKRIKEVLSLHDCLAAFTKPETLDEDNPWFCPNCKKNQCATKTISVWRYPPVLIIYLKRFIFHEGRSIKLDNKVTFPLDRLYLREAASARQQQTGGNIYDLYSCVCHTGGATGSGHYLAYAKNPQLTESWYRFNDDTVTRQRPQEEDYNLAYVLFYHRVDTPAVL